MKTTTTFLLLCLSVYSYAQEKINQLDSREKKDGKWIVYLTDKTWETVNDSNKAAYYRYTYYDHGTNIYPMGPSGGKNYSLITNSTSKQTKEKIQLLDGEYKWMDEKGRISSIHIFKNGEYVSCKEFFPSGKLSQFFDYTRNFEGQEHTYQITVYDEKGNLTLKYYMKKDDKGNWPRTR